jgi:hypothetical protein
MKKVTAILFMLFAAAAHAQSSGVATGTAAATSGGGTSALNFAPVSGSSTVDYKANSAIAPGMVAGFNTCLGSVVGAVQGASVGVSLGKTTPDDPCNLRSNSGQIFQMGDHAAAFALLCQNEDNAYAINVTGGITYKRDDGATVHRACPMSKDQWIAAGRPMLDPVTGQPYTDPPIVIIPAKVDPNVAMIEQRAADIARSQYQTVAAK